MRKYIITGALLICMTLSPEMVQAGIFNNAGTSAEDSISIGFQLLDSLGNPVLLDAADSVYFAVFAPSGGLCFKDSLDGNDPRIRSSNWNSAIDFGMYSLSEAVSSIDGDGDAGSYQYILTVDDLSLGLRSSVRGEFQIYPTADFSTTLDRSFELQDSMDALIQRIWVLQDSVDVLADSIANQEWASVGSGGDSVTTLRWTNQAVWGLVDHGDSSAASNRKVQVVLLDEDSAAIDLNQQHIGIDLSNVLNQDAPLVLTNSYLNWVGHVDTASIARSTWNSDLVPIQNRRIAFADTVGVALSTPSGGGGAYACSLYCFDASDTSAVQGVAVRVLNSAQNATIGLAASDVSGLAVFSLDAASYKIWSFLAGYIFGPMPQELLVDAPSAVDTLWAVPFDPGAPPEPGLCRVYGWVLSLAGEPIEGATVTASLRKPPVRYGPTVLSPFVEWTTTDSTGYWFIDLIPSSDLVPSNTSYHFSIFHEKGAIAVRDVAVPGISTWEFQW